MPELKIEQIQNQLERLGFSIRDERGNLGEDTQRAISLLQTKYRLEPTGELDDTIIRLIQAHLDVLDRIPLKKMRKEFLTKIRDGRPLSPRITEDDENPRLPAYLVRGKVIDVDENAAANTIVRAVDKDLRAEAPLGEAITDEEGNYAITYQASQFSRAEKKTADLIVRAYDQEDKLLAESPIRFNAGRVQTIYLVLTDKREGTSEWDNYLAEIEPILQGMRHEEFEEEHIRFLAGETGIPALHITFITIAKRYTKETEIKAEAFYGLFRQNLPTNLPALLLQPSSVLRQALEQSIAEEYVPKALERDLDEVVNQLQSQVVHRVFRAEEGVFPLSDLLKTTAVPESARERFMSLYLQHEDSPEAFWQKVEADDSLQRDGALESLRYTLQVDLITQNNVPVVNALQKFREEGKIQSVRDLPLLSEDNWRRLIQPESDGPVHLPEGIDGEDDEERIDSYLQQITETLKNSFPTVYLRMGVEAQPSLDRERVKNLLELNPGYDPTGPLSDDFQWGDMSEEELAKAKESLSMFQQEINMFPDLDAEALLSGYDNPMRRDMSRFLENFPDFDFKDHIETLSRENEEAFAGIENKKVLVADLKRFQRIMRITPRFEHARVLLGAGLHSASALVGYPLKNFIQDFGAALGGEMQARTYYAKAEQANAAITSVTTSFIESQYGALVNSINPGNQEVTKELIKTVPSLTELFGTLDLCECKHCRSVYGPASYFVDLLQFLRRSKSAPFNALMQRRPDLQHIKLSCQNSHTPLPYVDLVNEVLEFYVAHGQLGLELAYDTGDDSAEELSANAQHTLEAAYNILKKDAVHSFRLPFNRPLEVARIYLEHLGSSRYEVMTGFQEASESVTPSNITLEYLKISPEEYAILETGPTAYPVRNYYGYNNDLITFNDAEGDNITENWKTNLSRVPEFLRRTGVTYPDLVALLKTRFINSDPFSDPLPVDTVVLFSPKSVCDLQKTRIQHIDTDPDDFETTGVQEQQWMNMHRFLRLWQKLDWTMEEVDEAVQALGELDADGNFIINQTLLRKLAQVKQLQSMSKLSVTELLSFWASLNTVGDNPLYARLFQNKAVTTPLDGAFTMSGPGVEPEVIGDGASDMTLGAHVSTLLAALRLSEEDLTRLREILELNEPAAALDLENLTQLHRHALLGRALGLRINDFLAAKVLTGNEDDLFSPADPSVTVEFVKKIQAIQKSEFSIAKLNYLFRHLTDPIRPFAPQEEKVITLLDQLQQGLDNIVEETAVSADPTGEIIRQKLGLLLDGTRLDDAINLLEGQSTWATAEQAAFFDKYLVLIFSNVGEAKTLLLGASSLSIEDRRAYILPALMTHLRDSLSQSLIKQTLGDALGLEGTKTQFLLEEALPSTTNQQQSALWDFLTLVGDGLEGVYFANQDLSGASTLTRMDPKVNFYWGEKSPHSSLPVGAFSIRWSGMIRAIHSETYTFYLRAGGGVRLWLQNQLIIDDWHSGESATERTSSTVSLQTGAVYKIKIEYFADAGESSAVLSWSSLSTAKSWIPQSVLYSVATFVPLKRLLRAFEQLHKAAILVNGFSMTTEEAAHFNSQGAFFGNFKFAGLPLDRNDPDAVDNQVPTLFDQWQKLKAFLELRDLLPKGEGELLEALNVAPTEFMASLSSATGWDVDDIEFLIGPEGLNLPSVSLHNATGLTRLYTAFELSRRLGVSVAKLKDWATLSPDNAQAKEIRQTVKAKYGEKQWLDVAKPLNDRLRDMQRDALVTYVLAQESIVQQKIQTANQLFEYFLIDVEMEPCMMTSRLKQAISSVQLFVHRILLNLEEKISPKLIDQQQWEWMKNYRVWEANRKVFLYPENWIEPELRDNKTPFFLEMENELLQDEITSENVEKAFLHYLQNLDEVARLEIVGLYHQRETGVYAAPNPGLFAAVEL